MSSFLKNICFPVAAGSASANGKVILNPGIAISFPAEEEERREEGKRKGRCRASEELQLLLDQKHIQRWGKKVYHRDLDVELRPCLGKDRLFSKKDGRLEWTFRDDPVFRKMEEDFGPAAKKSRFCYGPDPCFVEAWRWRYAPRGGLMHVDLLYLCHADHEIYSRFPEHPNDPLGYMNADRFFFVSLPEGGEATTDSLLETVGHMHLHIHELGGMLMPGFAERDCLGLINAFHLVFVSGTEDEAKAVARRLKLFGRMLTIPSKTLEVRSLAWETLMAFPNRENDIHDLLAKVSTRLG